MPIYEFACKDCNRTFSFLVGVGSDAEEPACPRCGGANLSKLISRIARIKSKGKVMDELGELDKMGNIDDPKEMAQWAKKMAHAVGEETGEEFNEEEMDEMLEGLPGGAAANDDDIADEE
jgi:putative FmdB family regulatory protein